MKKNKNKLFLVVSILVVTFIGLISAKATCFEYCDGSNCKYTTEDPSNDQSCWIWGLEDIGNGSYKQKFEYGISKSSFHCPDGVKTKYDGGNCAITTLDKCKSNKYTSKKVSDDKCDVSSSDNTSKNNNTTKNNNTANNYNTGNLVSCGDKLITDMPRLIPKTVHNVYMIILVLVPVLLVVFGSIDFVKALIAQKDDEIKKGQQIFIKRLITGIIVFFIFAIVKIIISFAADNKSNILKCTSCIINNDDNCVGE